MILQVVNRSIFCHIFWEGQKILRNLHRRFVPCSNGQIYSGDFAKFCGLYQIFGQNHTLYTLNHRSVTVLVTILVKHSLWMGPKQKKRPWLCRIDQSLYCLVIHCCETRGEYHKTFWSACAFGKSHYGWESKWFCGFQHISTIKKLTKMWKKLAVAFDRVSPLNLFCFTIKITFTLGGLR